MDKVTEEEDTADAMLASSLRLYERREDRVAMRCALGDAAHLCDAVMRDIEREWRGRGCIKKRGVELAAIAKRCGDAIWKMRQMIDPNSESGRAALSKEKG